MITGMSSDAPQITPLTDDEQSWLTERLATAQEAGLLADPQLLADSFDTSRDDFRARPEHERGDASMLVNIYSVAFGEHFSRVYGLQWCIVTTGEGAEIGLFDPASESVLLPLATVAGCWADPGMRPMADLIAQTQASLESMGAVAQV